MAAMNLSSIFLGSIQSGERKFLRLLLEYLRKTQNYTKVIIPCVGQFGAVKCALEAGFKPEQIETSDISLFSSVLGYLASGRTVDEIGFEIVKESDREQYEALTHEYDKAAFLFLLMKLGQLRADVFYERGYINEINSNRPKYIKQLREQVETSIASMRGIKYERRDLRKYFYEDEYEPTTIVVMNPPLFRNGYTKMFAFEEYIKYKFECPEFDFELECTNSYFTSRDTIKVPFIWHVSGKLLNDIPSCDKIYAREQGEGKLLAVCMTIPELLGGFQEAYTVAPVTTNEQITHLKILPPSHRFSETDVIQVAEINRDTALYYRDLFAHRLGSTQAEVYVAIFVNGMLKAVSGFNTSFLRRLTETYVFENFCFPAPSEVYENSNRLDMMILLSEQFQKWFNKNVLKNSQYVTMKSLRTACLSKYRKVKLNNGLLKLESSERLPNDMYKLMYDQPFYAGWTFESVMKLYLKRDVKYKNGKVGEHPDEVTNVNLEALKANTNNPTINN